MQTQLECDDRTMKNPLEPPSFSPSPVLLDRMSSTSPRNPVETGAGEYNKRQKRAYHRAIVGLRLHRMEKRMIFGTLTTAGAIFTAQLMHDFELWKQWMRRQYPTMEYFLVRERNPAAPDLEHIHAILHFPKNATLDFGDMADEWRRIHSCVFANFEDVKGTSADAARYTAGYVGKEPDAPRFSNSQRWIVKGAVMACWYALKRQCHDYASRIDYFDFFLMGKMSLRITKRVKTIEKWVLWGYAHESVTVTKQSFDCYVRAGQIVEILHS